jgi:hypothetical protein
MIQSLKVGWQGCFSTDSGLLSRRLKPAQGLGALRLAFLFPPHLLVHLIICQLYLFLAIPDFKAVMLRSEFGAHCGSASEPWGASDPGLPPREHSLVRLL